VPPSRPGISYAFGPGPLTPAVRALLYANIAVFLVSLFVPALIVGMFGLTPEMVLLHLAFWQIVTYLFVHSPTQIMHIVLNMLFLWMFGVDLERRWGTRAFTKYYFVTGVGAGISVILVSLLPFAATRSMFDVPTIGASGAIYGLLMAWGLLFPHRQILFMLIVPLPARVFVFVMGAIAFVSAVGASGGAVSNVAHLGGLVIGYFYLRGFTNIRLAFRYRLTQWRMERMRRRFNIHRGGRDDWENRLH
jgi:membrane associated rhomboid family serine protease